MSSDTRKRMTKRGEFFADRIAEMMSETYGCEYTSAEAAEAACRDWLDAQLAMTCHLQGNDLPPTGQRPATPVSITPLAAEGQRPATSLPEGGSVGGNDLPLAVTQRAGAPVARVSSATATSPIQPSVVETREPIDRALVAEVAEIWDAVAKTHERMMKVGLNPKAGLARQIMSAHEEEPSLDEWRRCIELIPQMPEYAVASLPCKSLTAALRPLSGDPDGDLVLWRVGVGEWSDWGAEKPEKPARKPEASGKYNATAIDDGFAPREESGGPSAEDLARWAEQVNVPDGY